MGQKLTIGMNGRLKLSVNGTPAARPLDVAIESLQLDLADLMESGNLTSTEDDTKVRILLDGVTLGFTLDADEVFAHGAESMMREIEEVL